MNKIIFYKDKNGYSQISEWLKELRNGYKTNKNKRVQLEQFKTKITYLEQYGTRASRDTVKHIDEDIWEIRPGDNRILFFTYIDNKIVLLHQFRKKSKKTPKDEIAKAKRERDDWKERKI